MIVIFVLALLSVAQEIADRWCGQPSAVLWEDQLFVQENARLFTIAGGLFRGTFEPYYARVKSPVQYERTIVSGPTELSKLDIRNGRLLVFGAGCSRFHIVPFDELPGLEPNKFGDAVCRARGYRNASFLLDRYSGSTAWMLFPLHREPDVFPPPLPGFASAKPSEDEFRYRRSTYVSRARCDLQIAGPKEVRLFHAYKDKLFISIELDYLRACYYDKNEEIIKDPPPRPDRQLRTGKLPEGFTEYFAAYTAGKRDYMLTDNGKVYLAAPKGNVEVEVTAIWNDRKRRIAGVVQDQVNDAVYGWGYAGEPGSRDRFYVKFDPKPKAVAYKLTVPLWGDSTDAYLESYECVRAFRMANKK